MMGTTKLYQIDVYTKEWNAEVTKVTEDGIYLDQTAFFPEGGGQSCDLGTIQIITGDKPAEAVQVTDVQEDGDEVLHRLASYDGISEGCRVFCSLDWARRSTTCSATAASTFFRASSIRSAAA